MSEPAVASALARSAPRRVAMTPARARELLTLRAMLAGRALLEFNERRAAELRAAEQVVDATPPHGWR